MLAKCSAHWDLAILGCGLKRMSDLVKRHSCQLGKDGIVLRFLYSTCMSNVCGSLGQFKNELINVK